MSVKPTPTNASPTIHLRLSLSLSLSHSLSLSLSINGNDHVDTINFLSALIHQNPTVFLCNPLRLREITKTAQSTPASHTLVSLESWNTLNKPIKLINSSMELELVSSAR